MTNHHDITDHGDQTNPEAPKRRRARKNRESSTLDPQVARARQVRSLFDWNGYRLPTSVLSDTQSDGEFRLVNELMYALEDNPRRAARLIVLAFKGTRGHREAQEALRALHADLGRFGLAESGNRIEENAQRILNERELEKEKARDECPG